MTVKYTDILNNKDFFRGRGGGSRGSMNVNNITLPTRATFFKKGVVYTWQKLDIVLNMIY
jgi:hypothetical protein